MNAIYKELSVKIILFTNEDIVRTSQNDNVTDMPDFPENFVG